MNDEFMRERGPDTCGCPCLRVFFRDGTVVTTTDHDGWCGVQRRSEWTFDASGLGAAPPAVLGKENQ